MGDDRWMEVAKVVGVVVVERLGVAELMETEGVFLALEGDLGAVSAV